MSGFLSGALGNLLGGAGTNTGGGTSGGGLAGSAGGLLQQAFQSAGGVNGILDKCEKAGLGDKVRSWIGSGSNLPISPDEVERIFPPEQIDRWAQDHGLPAGAASEVLAHLLPHAVDQSTPDNRPPPATASDTEQPQDAAPPSMDFGGLVGRLLGGQGGQSSGDR